MGWLTKLGKDSRGSRPRCVLLTDGSREQVAQRLTRVVCQPEVVISPEDRWQPRGKCDVREAQLDKTLEDSEALLPEPMRRQMRKWWLESESKESKTPVWDIASTCTISGDKGLLLVEAKAHTDEWPKPDKCRAGKTNRKRIERALEEANTGLRKATGGSWQLSTEHCYQLSNRFAWSWKLSALGVPVVLLYLGFLEAQEMRRDQEGPFQCENDWKRLLLRHCQGVVDENCWNGTVDVKGTSLVPLFRVFPQPFPVE